ncbi:MAG: pyrroline-5-carboxylate reductase [Candidatus Omnitrophica bacterium]|nr:pyrroline-5-carboxylate reductase [Candidatus Omnitrophota bacterium]
MIGKKKFTFGIIGCGNIGNAIASGLIKYASIPPEKICANDTDKSKAKDFSKKFGIQLLDNTKLVKNSRFTIIAVKPKDIPELFQNISSSIDSDSILISVAAGVTIDSIKKMSGKNIPVIRFMPNICIGYGKGLVGYCSKGVSRKTMDDVLTIFSKTGFCFRVKESDMFFATAVAGSGPGFLFYLAEIIYDTLRKRGFSKKVAIKLLAYLFEGTGIMLEKSSESPLLLKEKVCSPGGTTLAGLSKMSERNFSEIINAALQAAEERAFELSEQKLKKRRYHE